MYILSAKRNKDANICTMQANICGMHYSYCFEAGLPKHRCIPTHILTWNATPLGQSPAQAKRHRLQVKNWVWRNRFAQCPQALNSWSDGAFEALRSPLSIHSGEPKRVKTRLRDELSYIIGAKLKAKRATSITLDAVQWHNRSMCQLARLRLQPSNMDGAIASCMLQRDGSTTALRRIHLHRC